MSSKLADIVIYSKESCRYCNLAKKFLEKQQIVYKEVRIGPDISREEVLAKYPDVKTVPVIIVDGVWIGGYDELVAHANKNGWMLLV